ncbi:unnamed protein product [Anisakis simplex]|uniref:THUMP domain-containing protein n=1 Tax=Anisakis simplex TaxID=6269 RepID=A0A0M3JXN6_ANISI|nr:unnamed protein product [Anisakis simplex]
MSGQESRKRASHQWRRIKQKSIEPGVSGLFFTCSANEKQALREAYNLLNCLIEKQQETSSEVVCKTSDECQQTNGRDSQKMSDEKNDADAESASDNSPSDAEDVADTIKRFCSNARQSNSVPFYKNRLKQRPTGVKNCLFVAVDGDLSKQVYDLADQLVARAAEQSCCRLLQRVIPIEITCRIDMPTIERLVSKHFTVNEEDGKWPTYSVEFKARNNSGVKRNIMLEMVCGVVKQMAPMSRICLDAPDIALLFQVLHNTALLSCVRNFHQRRKMSLHVERNPSNEPIKTISNLADESHKVSNAHDAAPKVTVSNDEETANSVEGSRIDCGTPEEKHCDTVDVQ